MTPFGSNNLLGARPRFGFPPALVQINLTARAPHNLDVGARAVHFFVAARLYENSLLLVLVLLPLLHFPNPWMWLGLVGALVFFALRWLALGSPVPLTRINVLLLLFFSSVLWGMLRSPYLGDTVLSMARWTAGYVTLVFVLDYAERPGRLWNVAAALVLFGLAVAVLTPFITRPADFKYLDTALVFPRRALSFLQLSNANVIADTLAALVPLALALILSRERGVRIVGSVSIAPLLVIILLLQARGAWIAVTSGMLLFASLFRRWLFVLLPAFVLIFMAMALVAQSLEPPEGAPRWNLFAAPLSLEGRQVVWTFAAQQIVAQPLGIGINAFPRAAANAASDVLDPPQLQHAHNLFLQAGLDLGLIGLGAFAAIHAYALYAAFHAYQNQVKRVLALGVFAALSVVLIADMFEITMWNNKSTFVLWALFGMAVVFGRYGARRRHRQRGTSLQSPAADV